jgi:hypothetical protein
MSSHVEPESKGELPVVKVRPAATPSSLRLPGFGPSEDDLNPEQTYSDPSSDAFETPALDQFTDDRNSRGCSNLQMNLADCLSTPRRAVRKRPAGRNGSGY